MFLFKKKISSDASSAQGTTSSFGDSLREISTANTKTKAQLKAEARIAEMERAQRVEAELTEWIDHELTCTVLPSIQRICEDAASKGRRIAENSCMVRLPTGPNSFFLAKKDYDRGYIRTIINCNKKEMENAIKHMCRQVKEELNNNGLWVQHIDYSPDNYLKAFPDYYVIKYIVSW